jgi:phosphoribosylaminoimidazole-succinocarboxamide synthase
MNRRRKIYEGKAKILYEGPEPGTLVQHFKDDATAGNGAKHEVIEGKGVLNNRISEFVFTRLNTMGIPTHFVRRINMREQLIREVEIIPIEVVVRNVAAGSLCKRLGLESGTQLPRSIMALAVRVNDFLTGLFMGVGIQLVDFKLECGRLFEGDMMRIVLADEISPDNCRLWDIKTRNKLDKDRFREDLGGLVDAYREVAQRLGILVEADNALTTGPRLVQ